MVAGRSRVGNRIVKECYGLKSDFSLYFYLNSKDFIKLLTMKTAFFGEIPLDTYKKGAK